MGELVPSLVHPVGLTSTWCIGWGSLLGGMGRLFLFSALVSSSLLAALWWACLLLGALGGTPSLGGWEDFSFLAHW